MIGENTELIIQSLDDSKVEYDKNGKRKEIYKSIASIFGFKDLIDGNSGYIHKAKIEDSTHIFICDYIDLKTIDVENSRALINNQIYDLKYIDDVMELHEHLEIYLKLVGGQ